MPVDSSNKYNVTFMPYTSKAIQGPCSTENYMSSENIVL
jgi:hypothetical protein